MSLRTVSLRLAIGSRIEGESGRKRLWRLALGLLQMKMRAAQINEIVLLDSVQ